jgi:hypothetical protein
MDEFAADYGLSQSQLFNWLKRDEPPLAKHWTHLAQFFGVSKEFIATGTPVKLESEAPHAVAESPAIYKPTPDRNLEKSVEYKCSLRSKKALQLRPEFQLPAPMPTREDCTVHVTAYLDAAAHAPGGYAIALHKIKRALPLDDFAPSENSPQ